MKKEIEISAPQGYSFKEVRDGKIVFEQDVLPESWEEYCKNYPITAEECFVTDSSNIIYFQNKPRDSVLDANVIKNEDIAKAILALNKLIHLRDCYRQGWTPDWANEEELKYCVIIERRRPVAWEETTIQHILSFQSPEVLDEFMHNFDSLIEDSKELL